MAVVLAYLGKVETELGTHLLPHVFLEVFNLAGIFESSIRAMDQSTPLCLGIAFLEETRLRPVEGGRRCRFFAIGVMREIVDIDSFAFECFPLNLIIGGHGEGWQQEHKVDDGPCSLFED